MGTFDALRENIFNKIYILNTITEKKPKWPAVKIVTKFTMLASFPFSQFCTFVVFQSLVGRIGNLGNGDQLGKNKPDDAKEGDDDPSDQQVPPHQ